VAPSGLRIWRFKFRQPNGKDYLLTFGTYPEISLEKEAREKRRETSRLMLKGLDLEWVSGFNCCRLLAPFEFVPPAEAKEKYYQQKNEKCRVKV
jgi:hypothetical protein